VGRYQSKIDQVCSKKTLYKYNHVEKIFKNKKHHKDHNFRDFKCVVSLKRKEDK
jgi:hypothetical protein